MNGTLYGAKSLVLLTSSHEIADIINIKPSTNLKHYETYNALIHRISKENNVEVEALEMFLFEQNF